MVVYRKDESRSRHISASGAVLSLRRVLFAVLVALLASCAHVPSQLGDIRDKMFNAYGGRERLAQIRSIAAEGTITAPVRGDHGTYRRAWRRDGKLFVDIRYSQSRETRILNGTQALRGVDGKWEEATGPRYLAMVYQYNELSMPFALLDGTYTVEELDSEQMGDRMVRTLHCTDRAGNSIDVFVDEGTYRIVKTQGNFTVDGKATTLSAVFGDFRFFEGVLMPYKIVNYAGDAMISETDIDEYLMNANLSDALFGPHAHIPEQKK